MMIKSLYIFGVVLFVCGLLYQFAALKVFNLVMPRDSESHSIARGIAYGNDDSQKMDIYGPNVGHDLPVLIFVHGGSWKNGSRVDYDFAGRAFAAQGYLTLVMDYRLIPAHAYPAFVEDVAKMFAWASVHAKEYGGDGERIYAVGHSAGAYNVALASLDEHYLRDVGVNPKIVKGVAGISGPYDFLPLDSPLTIAAFGEVKDLVSTQPIHFARRMPRQCCYCMVMLTPWFIRATASRSQNIFPMLAGALF